jgi:hypothetical protein
MSLVVSGTFSYFHISFAESEKKGEDFIAHPFYYYNYKDTNNSISITSECIVYNKGDDPLEVNLMWKDMAGNTYIKDIIVPIADTASEGVIEGRFSTTSLKEDFPAITQENVNLVKPPAPLEGACFSLRITASDISLIRTELIDHKYPITAVSKEELSGTPEEEERLKSTSEADNAAPQVSIQSIEPNPAMANQVITFTANIKDVDGDSDVKYLMWDFGNGNSVVGGLDDYKIYKYTYPKSGVYKVILRVEDKADSVSQDERKITVNPKSQVKSIVKNIIEADSKSNIKKIKTGEDGYYKVSFLK